MTQIVEPKRTGANGVAGCLEVLADSHRIQRPTERRIGEYVFIGLGEVRSLAQPPQCTRSLFRQRDAADPTALG
ncbi:MAG TPA: hypothetical protein VLP43_11600 [Solirubrobacteraceae bacterium]|nr:hypothetical protein [Solirubrobacteraceae bacterium]